MKAFIYVTLFLGCIGLHAQNPNPAYDAAVAAKYDGDEYGMKQYVLAILKTGPNTTANDETVSKLFRGHMDNIGKMAADGKLVVAGPMQKNDQSYRGIFILNAKSIAEAQQMLESDPAIREKLLVAELYTWYGSAALPAYLEVHQKIEKNKF